jgi:hypothetical protein
LHVAAAGVWQRAQQGRQPADYTHGLLPSWYCIALRKRLVASARLQRGRLEQRHWQGSETGSYRVAHRAEGGCFNARSSRLRRRVLRQGSGSRQRSNRAGASRSLCYYSPQSLGGSAEFVRRRGLAVTALLQYLRCDAANVDSQYYSGGPRAACSAGLFGPRASPRTASGVRPAAMASGPLLGSRGAHCSASSDSDTSGDRSLPLPGPVSTFLLAPGVLTAAGWHVVVRSASVAKGLVAQSAAEHATWRRANQRRYG